MAVNKVTYGGETLIDLTGDTVTEETLTKGATAHNAAGIAIEGQFECAIEHIQVNGVEQEIKDQTVNLKVPTNDEMSEWTAKVEKLEELVCEIVAGRVTAGAMALNGAGLISSDGSGILLNRKIDVIEVEKE